MTKSAIHWNHLTSTLWFVPSILVLGGILLGFLLIEIDVLFINKFGYFPRLFDVQPSGAREMLAVIAASTITVAGTVFSITIVALTLASTQFSPRILRNFMRDTGNQVVLGTLVGIFAYCIIVLRTIRDGGDNPGADFVPSNAVVFGILLGLVGIICLIYYIHHVAISIQATSIISGIAEDTIKEIQTTFPLVENSVEVPVETRNLLAADDFLTVKSNVVGYIQNADAERLSALAEKHDLILKMQRRVGQFTVKDLPLLKVYPLHKNFVLDSELRKAFIDAYDISNYRTVEGDVAFGIRQIVDIALKALSPAINDSTTAVICVDYLTAILSALAKRPSCPANMFVKNKLRLVVEQQRFEDFFDLAFNQIRQNADGNVAVILRMLNSINVLSKIDCEALCGAERAERHNLLVIQARLLNAAASRTIAEPADTAIVATYFKRVEKSLAENRSV